MMRRKAQPVDRFELEADQLIQELVERRSVKPGPRDESPNAWFKRNSYAFLRDYIESGREAVFCKLIDRDRRSHVAVKEATKNVFKAGLLAMVADDEIISRNDRSVFGNQMLYAWAHDVPPEFLNAFIGVSGSSQVITQKLLDRFIEPGCELRYRQDRLHPRDP
jgi:hypothetical protein